MSNIIENNAFNQCNNLKTIEIPNSIEEISTNMINDCDSIENIMGTDSIKVVDNCYLIKNGTLISIGKELSQYIIPEGVTSIGYGVFKNNLDAEYIVVPNTVTNIEAEAFRNCKNLKSITLSNTLESIGDLCFENCSSLTILHIPDSVSNVGINLLDGCTSLVDLYMSPNIDLSGNIYDIMSGVKEVIEDNLRYQGNILLGVYDNTLEHYNIKEGTIVICKNAFSNCHRMKTINIPSSVKYIQDYAFRGCKLDSINLPEGLVEIGNWAFSDSTTANSLIIPSTVKTINNYAFHGNEFTKVTILGDVKEIGRYAFSTSPNIDTMVISFKSSNLPIIKNDSFSINWNKGKLCIDILDELFNSNELSEEWLQYKRDGILFSNKTINDELPYISYEFNNETGLLKIMGKANIPNYQVNIGLENRPWHDFISSITSIEISDNISYIGANAFKGCTNLKRLVIPNGITSLQTGIIANCEKIEEIVIPDSVKTIDNIYGSIVVRDNKIKINYLGSIDDWLNIDILMNDYEFINNFSLYINNQDVKEITNYTIKDGITTIKNLTFANWTSLENITIPNSVKKIEGKSLNGGAFSNCKNIKNVYYKGDLSSWCNIDFGTVESNPLCYGANLYINDKEVSDITIPSNTIIKDYIFVGNKSLKSVNISNNILKIGKYAFQDCINLTNVSIPEGVISIEDNAFCGCSKLTSITIPNSVVKIGRAVFSECNNLTNLTLSNNLIIIGGYAFNGCKSLLNITIPINIDTIDEWTFHNCINLKNVEFGDNITSIGNGSFNGCINLTSIIIPNSVTHIGTSTFTGCEKLVNITIPDALLLNDDLCKDIIKKNTIINGEECIINDEEIIVNKRLISYLKNDTEYTIPENVTSIGKKAFYECSSLTNVIIPNSVMSIDDYAFGFCTNLTSVIIPDSVVSIGKNVFSNCGKLKNITIGNGVTTIGDYAFSNCNSLVSIIFGNNVTSIGNYAFSNCTTLSNVYISNISDWCKIDFGTYTSNPLYNGAKLYINNVEIPSTLILPNDAKYIGTYAFYNCSALKDVYIPNSVTDIAKNAFSNCINLTSITIAAKNINCDFNNCKNLESIKITDDVETISNLDIFKGCDNLKSITLGKNISNLPNLYSNKIESLTIKNKNINLESSNFANITPTSIRDYKIYLDKILIGVNNYTLSEYIIDEGTEHICTDIFTNCKNMQSITIPSSIISCGYYKGSGVDNVLTINTSSLRPFYDNGISYFTSNNIYINGKTNEELMSMIEEKIEDYKIVINQNTLTEFNLSLLDFIILLKELPIPKTSYANNNIKTIEIDVNCYNIDNDTISKIFNIIGTNFEKLENLILSDNTGITFIPSKWNKNIKNIKSIKLPNTINKFEKNAFYNCESLEKIILSDINNWFNIDLETNPLFIDNNFSIKLYINENENTQSVIDIPNTLSSIKKRTFENWNYVTTINIPNTIKKIGINAFDECDSLESIYYNGTEEEWNNISFEGIVKIGNAKLFINNKEVEDITSFNGCRVLGNKKLIIPDYVFEIGIKEYENDKEITSVIIHDNVLNIGHSAFYGCSSLMYVKLSNKIMTIPSYLFYKCTSLEDIVIPDSVTTIESNAFYGCTNLKNIVIPDSVTTIESYAFDGCNSLTSITIPNSVTKIATGAFYGCANLKNIVIPDSVTTIESNAFKDCKNLESVTIGNNVISIGESAFENCSNLSNDIIIPDSVTTIGNNAFYNCDSLTNIIFGKGIKEIQNNTLKSKKLKSITLLNGLVKIPETLSSVGTTDFTLNVYVDNIKDFCEENYIGYFNTKNKKLFINGVELLNELVITENITKICKKCFYNFKFDKITILNNDKLVISEDAFQGCIVKDLYINNVANWCNIFFENYYSNPLSINNINMYINNEKIAKKDLIIPDGVVKINDYAFVNLTLNKIELPITVTTIGNSSFEKCTFIENIIVGGENITTIGDKAFYAISGDGRNEIKLNFSTNLEKIGNYAFADGIECVKKIILPDSVSYIGNSCFENNNDLEEVCIGNGLKIIPKRAFYNCSKLQNINFEENTCLSLEEIQDEAFLNCRLLFYGNEYLKFPNSINKIGNNVFTFYTSKIKLPDSLTTLGSNVFGEKKYTHKLDELYLPKSLIFLQEDSLPIASLGKFDGDCKYITPDRRCVVYNGKLIGFAPAYIDEEGNYNYIDNVKENISKYTMSNNWGIVGIDSKLFVGMSIDTIVLPNTIVNIPEAAFRGSSIENIIISDYTLSINEYAFAHNEKLKSVVIPESVNSIEYGAFNLAAINEEEKNYIKFNLSIYLSHDTPPYISPNAFNIDREGVRKDMNLSIYVKDEASKNEFLKSQYWSLFKNNIKVLNFSHSNMKIEKNTLIINIDEVHNIIGKGNLNLYNVKEHLNLITNIEVKNEKNIEYSISEEAFSYFSSLNIITFDEGLTHIGNNAFIGCNLLSEVNLPESLKYIGSSAFDNCYDLTDIKLYNNIEYIGEKAFRGTKIRSVNISDKLTKIEPYTFSRCKNLINVTISDSVTSIGNNAFDYCEKLYSIKLPNSITIIESSAFSNSGVTNISLPNKIKRINGGTFRNTKIKEIYIPNSVEYIGAEAFGYCYDLESIKNLHKNITLVEGFCLGCNNVKNATGDLVSNDGTCVILNKNLLLFINKTPNIIKETYKISEDVETIGYGAFWCNNPAKEIDFSNVNTINAYAFKNCDVETIIAPFVTYLGDYCFYECKKLINISIPNLSNMGNNPFRFCSNITKFNFSCSDDGLCLIKKNTNIELVSFIPGNNYITEYTLPNEITSIGTSAFNYDTLLEKIIINDNISNIKYNSFNNLSLKELDMTNSQLKHLSMHCIYYGNITNFKLPRIIEEIDDISYTKIENLYCYNDIPPKVHNRSLNVQYIYVPADKVDIYKQDENWSIYSSKIKPIE